VDVWLWDSADPSAYAGVTDREDTAIKHAEALLTKGESSTARVEIAFLNVGGGWLNEGYHRTGSGLTAARAADGSVKWTRFYLPALAAS
jgi:hypothetical protein